ncbi:MAG: ribosome-associated translation inhibitor RaiA [Anaerolineaceae bacterium]|nr:ribosome-associated translation inhibitor RaiA [Anaerolineaceae bacterium]
MQEQIELFAKNLEVTERINDYVMKKVSKLDKFMGGIEETRVDLAYEKAARNAADRQVAQITVRGKGAILRTEERANDIFEAIDAAVDKMQRKMERFKGKRQRGRGDGTTVAEIVAEPLEAEEAAEGPVIAKRKSFHLVPMDELEAVEQMELLGHENFFVFYNVDNDAINVLYRRRDGTYGLITPEIG